jgi:hypothetical protein
MLDPSEKLPSNHAYDAQSFGLANALVELFEHSLQTSTIGEIERFAGKLIERFAHGSAGQVAVSPSSAVLQAADEMKVAELHDPALALAEPDNSRNLVGDRGPDAFVYGSGDGRDGLRPTAHILPAGKKHRIEEEGSILMARFDRHHIQYPVFSSKAEVKSVQDQNQRPSWQPQTTRSGYKLSQRCTKTPSQPLSGQTVAWCESFQCAAFQKDCSQRSRTRSLRLAPSAFDSNSPRPLAVTALTTSRTEVINFGSATWGFRVPRMHARELHTKSNSKCLKTRRHFV